MADELRSRSPALLDAIARGRNQLLAWRRDDTANWYADNRVLKALVAKHAGDSQALHESLSQFARDLAAAEPLVHRCSHDPHTPVLERFDAYGRRHERVRFDASYHEVGKIVYGSGVMGLTGKAGGAVEQAALVILASHHGEGGHTCPLACTAGLIKAVQQVGHPALQAALLPGLTERDYAKRLHGAQFLTEVQGGSDVGANATRATPIRPETAEMPAVWAIAGEKWFCSVVDAPLYVLTARPDGAKAGTGGLGLFIVPHDLPPPGRVAAQALSHRAGDVPNVVNEFTIRRLKHKLGTRAMASGEVDWHGALAWQLGPVDRGFHHAVDIVLNTSRLFNAMACAGMFWRAYREAAGFALHREAFGRPIAEFPAVDRALAQLFVEAAAASASTIDLAALGDSGQHREALRLATNANKYWTSIRCTQMVRLAMEVLAGNAAIEDFTPLGRLYRDCMVTEAWEGTHNVLAAQTWRDMVKLRLHDAWLQWMRDRASRLAEPLGGALAGRLAKLAVQAAELIGFDPDSATLPTRTWMENAMVVHQAVCLSELGEHGGVPPEAVEHFLALHPLHLAVGHAGFWPGRVARPTSSALP